MANHAWVDLSNVAAAEVREAVVVGAGIAGCQMAHHLAQKGWRVTVIEQASNVACEGSGNRWALISPKMILQEGAAQYFYQRSFDYVHAQVNQLHLDSAASSIIHSEGLLQCISHEREQKRWQHVRDNDGGLHGYHAVGADDASALAGVPIEMPALWHARALSVDTRAYCLALMAHPNITCHFNCAVHSISHSADQGWHLVCEDQDWRSAHVILANASALNHFIDAQYLPTQNVLGQTNLARASETSARLKCSLAKSDYILPAGSDGMHVYGATHERLYASVNCSMQATDSNRKALLSAWPNWATALSAHHAHHAAVRCNSLDRLPLVGPVADFHWAASAYADIQHGRRYKTYPAMRYQQGLFVIAGLGSRGFSTAAWCANILTRLMTDGGEIQAATMGDLHTLLPHRFFIKWLKKNTA